MTAGRAAVPERNEPVFPNTGHVARREYRELTRSRIFHVSTITLTILAVIVALLPIGVRLVQRGGTTRIDVVASSPDLARTTRDFLDQLLNGSNGQDGRQYTLSIADDADSAIGAVDDHVTDAAVIATRLETGQIAFSVHAGETVGDATIQLLNVGTLGVAFYDFANRTRPGSFQFPAVNIVRNSASGIAGAPYDPGAYASRLIVGIVFGFLVFLTIIIYGMWVAAGVVAEKASRVMELLVSAASPRQLVLGKAIGIGLAGATQIAIVLVPAVLVLLVEDQLARALLGPKAGITTSLQALSPGLILAFLAFYVLGFALYSLIYAAAGSLVSRAEDLQIIALPLSLIAITGYLQAILALTGGITWFIRLASFVPFWSPFVMLTRLSVGRVEPQELVISIAILAATIVATAVVAIRIYGAGVLLYGQRPGLRAYVAAARHG